MTDDARHTAIVRSISLYEDLAILTADEPRQSALAGPSSSGPKVETAEGRRHFELSTATASVRTPAGGPAVGLWKLGDWEEGVRLEQGQDSRCPREP